MVDLVKNLKKASIFLRIIKPELKTQILFDAAEEIIRLKDEIISANLIDIKGNPNLSSAMKDRLLLDEKRIEKMANSVKNIANLQEPVGKVLDGFVNKSGLEIQKISIPIGVICVIYESRPDVTSEVLSLCLKSSNACILKGGKEAVNSNKTILKAFINALRKNGVSDEILLYLDISRDEVASLLKLDEYIDLVIPRGGEQLVKFVAQNSIIPVLKHDKGLCHIYVDRLANLQKALQICINAKCSRPSACNAVETIIIHSEVAFEFLPNLAKEMAKFGVKFYGCKKSAEILDCQEADYTKEHLDFALNLIIVDSLDEAILHIEKFSSSHSEAIISDDYEAICKFTQSINSSCVYVNASTRFSDGGEFGFGGEIGISTNKLHARGPVGLLGLTTYKYIIKGQGQIRI